MGWLWPDAVSVVGPSGFNCCISFALVFICLYCLVIIIGLSAFYLDLYVI